MHTLLVSVITNASAAPPSATCVPGQDGVPGSVLGNLVCGTWATDTPGTLLAFARDHRPLLAATALLLITARIVLRVWRRAVWRRHAAQARWLEIVPPVSATPAATVELWRLLASVLPASRWWAWRPYRLVWEIAADPKGMRCGLWLPPGVNPTAVLRLVQRAWPGARAEQTRPPRLVPGSPAAAVSLAATQPEWLPLVDAPAPAAGRRWEAGAPPEDDRLRAVFDGLAAAGRTGGGLLQVHVTRAPRHRVDGLRRATINPQHARRPRSGASRLIGLTADGLRALLIGVLDLVTPGPSSRRTTTGRADPYLAEQARHARAKLHAGPHLLVAVHATATGPTRAAAQAAAADITSGYSLLSAHFYRRRLHRAHTTAASRWVPAARMTLASVHEAAALAGLPAEPSTHGLPAAASRRRPVSREVFTAAPATSRRPHHPAADPADRADGDPDQGDPDQGDPATVWNTP